MSKNYKVEDVIDEKEHNGVMMYRIKWEGYPRWQNTWQPKDNISAEVLKLWEEKKVARQLLKQKRQQQQKAKEQRREFWWHETKILRHYHDDNQTLLFEVKNQNRIREVTRDQLLKKSSRILAKYYIQQAKKQKIY